MRAQVEFLRAGYGALERGDLESVRGGGSGVPVAQEVAVVWSFEGERAVCARSFGSAAEALESARASSET